MRPRTEAPLPDAAAAGRAAARRTDRVLVDQSAEKMKWLSPSFLRSLVLLTGLSIGLVACDDDATGPGSSPSYTRDADVAFAVRGGTTINATGLATLFDEKTDQAMTEIPIDFPETDRTTLLLEVGDYILSIPNPIQTFHLAIYEANGTAETADYDAGPELDVLALSVSVADNTDDYMVDVTARMTELRAAGATHLGVRLYDASLSQLHLVSASLLAES